MAGMLASMGGGAAGSGISSQLGTIATNTATNQLMSNPIGAGISGMMGDGGTFLGGLGDATKMALKQGEDPEQKKRQIELLEEGQSKGLGQTHSTNPYNALMDSPEWQEYINPKQS